MSRQDGALRDRGEAALIRAADDAALPLAIARARIAADVTAITGTERVALRDALGRVLAADLFADANVPAHDNAAMDGYAVRSSDFAADALPATLPVVGRAAAGAPFAHEVVAGTCVRILTGAVIPGGCDAVVAQEDVEVDDDHVTFAAAPRPGAHRRLAGEDLRAGAVVLGRGRRLRPPDLGLAASVGAATVEVLRRARVAVFSTGTELREVDGPLPAGCIRDSNRYTLLGLLTRLGMDVVDLGIVADDPTALTDAVHAACDHRVDAIVTSGGVSAGDADHTRDVMARVGQVSFWKLAIKPGRPMAFGRVACRGHSALLFALPGNPVAAMVVFYALVRSALLALAGAYDEPLVATTATCDAPIAKVPGRTEFVRGVTSAGPDGWHVRPTGAQGSGILRSMSEANCLIVLSENRGPVTAGESVECWPFEGIG